MNEWISINQSTHTMKLLTVALIIALPNGILSFSVPGTTRRPLSALKMSSVLQIADDTSGTLGADDLFSDFPSMESIEAPINQVVQNALRSQIDQEMPKLRTEQDITRKRGPSVPRSVLKPKEDMENGVVAKSLLTQDAKPHGGRRVRASVRETGQESIRQYMETMCNHELLSKNEEIILAREIQILISWEEKREDLEAHLIR